MAVDDHKLFVTGINYDVVDEDEIRAHFADNAAHVVSLDFPRGQISRGPCVLTFLTPEIAKHAMDRDVILTHSQDRLQLKILPFRTRGPRALTVEHQHLLRAPAAKCSSVMVSRLEFTTHGSAVRALCETVGVVVSVDMQPPKRAPKLGGRAVVQFAFAADASRAAAELNGQPCPPSGAKSRRVKVELHTRDEQRFAEVAGVTASEAGIASTNTHPEQRRNAQPNGRTGDPCVDVAFLAKLETLYGGTPWPESRDMLKRDLESAGIAIRLSETLYALSRTLRVLKVEGGAWLRWNEERIKEVLTGHSLVAAAGVAPSEGGIASAAGPTRADTREANEVLMALQATAPRKTEPGGRAHGGSQCPHLPPRSYSPPAATRSPSHL